jgi:hypothetical protein
MAGTNTAPRQIYTFDARPLRSLDLRQAENARKAWDSMHALAAIQGVANRHQPRLYLYYCADFGVDTDRFWFDWLRGEDGWLRDVAVVPLADFEAVIQQFRDEFRGLAVYDGTVPATACAASTAAACDALLPVRFDEAPDSLYTNLRELGLPVRLWLVNPDGSARFRGQGLIPDTQEPSSGSAKVDVYRWAKARYLRTGQCHPQFAAYYLDAFWLQRPTHGPADLHTLSNHDYFIARRAFFFDLSPWADEAPIDDPGQPLGLDRRMLLDILGALAEGARGSIVKIGGFPPWPYKYTTHGGAGRHEGVPTEWEFTRLISQFNAYKEADAAGHGAMANASFFQHYPLKKRYSQPNRRPTLADWRAQGCVTAQGRVAGKLFVGHYVGDYDSPSWLYKAVPAFFNDPARGEVPLGWAFDPNLEDRAPQALAYAYRYAGTNDHFIAGNSGAGYLNVRALTVRPESRLPSGLKAWARHCQPYFRRWDMTITGFILDGSAGAATETELAVYRRFSPDGLGTHFERGPALRAGIPTCPERDLPHDLTAAAQFILDQAAKADGRAQFLWARSILRPPRWYADLARRVKSQPGGAAVEFVDPYTFFGLVRLACAADAPHAR